MDKPGEAPGAYRGRHRRGLAALGAAVLFALLLAPGVILVHPDYLAAQATTWARQFGTPGPDNAKGVGVDSAGNVYVVGQTSGTLPGQSWGGGLSDAYLKKYDQQGEEVWLRQFGGSGDDAAHAVAVDDSGNVYVAGRTGGDTAGAMMTGGASGAFLLKFNPEGAELWNRVFGLENFASSNSVAIGPQGNVYLTGSVRGALPGQIALGPEDAFVRKYRPNGEELWTAQLGGLGADFASDVAVSDRGNVHVVGWHRNNQPGQVNVVSVGSFVHVFDGDGQSLWSKRLETSGFSQATGVDVDEAGNLYLSGWISGVFPGQPQVGATDAFLGKYGPAGELLWVTQFGTSDEERALDVAAHDDGGAYVVGWTRGIFAGQTEVPERAVLVRRDGFVRRYDWTGKELWTRQFGTTSDQSANSVVIDDAGGLLLTGETSSPLFGQGSIGGMDVFLGKMSGGSPQVPPMPDPTSPSTAMPGLTPEPEIPENVTPLRRHNPTGFCRFSGVVGTMDLGWGLLGLGLLGLAAFRRRVG